MSLLQERQEAKKLFATENGQPDKATPPPAKTFVPGEIPSDDLPETEEVPVQVEEPSRKGPTPEQIIAIKVMFAFKARLLVSSHLGCLGLCFIQGLNLMLLPSEWETTPSLYVNFACCSLITT
jgi:hypothetical protein